MTLEIYQPGRGARPGKRGIIIADTKVEFGRTPDGTLVLADEVLTPDSSRFWDGRRVGARPRPGLVRQADRARLGGRHRVGQDRARARRARRTWWRGPARATSRCTSG